MTGTPSAGPASATWIVYTLAEIDETMPDAFGRGH
jgi:hypothetical protein